MSMSQSFSIVADAVTSIQGAYSNNWAFGVFEKWWAVDPQEFAFASAATSQATTKRTKPSRVAGLNTQQQQSNTKQQDDDESDELERNDTPILSLKMPSRTLISPPSQVHLQSLDWDHHHHQYGNGSNMPHHNAIHTTQPLRSPTISIISSNHERPTHSITPIVSTALCPCITFAQNREMFLRSGGVIENDHIERCCGHPSVDSTESGRIWQSALCFTSVMPCCLCCIPHRSLRKSIRSRYALRDLDADGEGGECGELLLSFCCMSCSLVQERREILHWDGVVGDAKKRRSVVL
ncbi:hypothetical protein BDR26DRAFT_866998 [Obelidium mucronatum]|nr:hypothetical protein BDR26DRAFT_866998 [Obelidium mucronatum]